MCEDGRMAQMNPYKVALGILLLVISVWMVPYVSDLLGVEGSLSYLAVGSVPAFVGGMVFHSGVRECRRWRSC